jgi:OOP family OmpA-OmpF porin
MVEFGGFGSYTFFDKSLPFDDNVGGGGHLGLFLFSRLALEGGVSFTATEGDGLRDITHIPLRTRLVYNQPLFGSVRFLLGAGYVHNEYSGDLTGADNGVTGLAALRIRVAGPLALRLEGILDYMPSPANATTENWNYGGQAGLSFLLGPLFRGRGPEVFVEREPVDSDRDGVADPFDACPDTPRGEQVDSRGCPLPEDSDGDGVLDADDACPETPTGVAVDARGCPLPEDSDGDGVVDTDDACPETPTGVAVDARGCPLPEDSDGDGVVDADDACPNTPAGERVDARGCPPLFEEGATRLVLEGVSFESNNAELTPAARGVLDRVAASLIANPAVRVEVAGHTDDSGFRPYNLILSQARASAVRQYLMSRGVAGVRLLAKGYGPDDPVASNATPEGRAMNRRVELRRLE